MLGRRLHVLARHVFPTVAGVAGVLQHNERSVVAHHGQPCDDSCLAAFEATFGCRPVGADTLKALIQRTSDERMLVVAAFVSSACPHSRLMVPVLRSIVEKRGADAASLQVVYVDMDTQPELCAQLGLTRPPTYLLFADGVEQHRVGASPQTLVQLIEDLWPEGSRPRSGGTPVAAAAAAAAAGASSARQAGDTPPAAKVHAHPVEPGLIASEPAAVADVLAETNHPNSNSASNHGAAAADHTARVDVAPAQVASEPHTQSPPQREPVRVKVTVPASDEPAADNEPVVLNERLATVRAAAVLEEVQREEDDVWWIIK